MVGHTGELNGGDEPSVSLVARCCVAVCDGPFRSTDHEGQEVHWIDRAGLDELSARGTVVPDAATLLVLLLGNFSLFAN
jgi:hypothetical protein